MSATTTYEPIIIIDTDGGRVTVSRLNESASCQYFVEAVPNEFAHEVIESLRVFRIGPFESVERALDTLARDGAWMQATPVMVHADVRETVRAALSAHDVLHSEGVAADEWRRLADVVAR